MALSFYTDGHIAKAVAEQLAKRDIDVLRCEDAGMKDASDVAHLTYATARGRILISQDDDFIKLHVEWQQASRAHAGIMRVPPKLKSGDQVSYVVNEILFYHEAEKAGAVDYATEIFNQVIFL